MSASARMESLVKAVDCLGFALGDLREALRYASALEADILYNAIREVSEARRRVKLIRESCASK